MQSPSKQPAGFRPDVEGLRAVAVATVLLAHAGVPFAAGGYIGVDVFFVISGFVITRLLLKELTRSGRVSLVRFYARRGKRLLPLAATVLVATVAVSAWQEPMTGIDAMSRDVVAAGVYMANWHFAGQATDYFAGVDGSSPVQHFWSLAVEEQFYLVWPLLLLGLWSLAARLPRRPGKRTVAVSLAGIAALSFAHAAATVATAPGAAYFSTFARVWELALGALIAVVIVDGRVPARIAALLGWLGLLAIGAAMVLFDEHTLVPGPAALLPTLGAVALIVGGASARAGGVSRLLATRPFGIVGAHSYALYLWHWPVIVFAAARWGPLSPAEGLLAVAVSIVPTVVTHRWIEEPLRRSKLHTHRPRPALAFAPTCAALVVCVALLAPALHPSASTLAAEKARGATVMRPGATLQKRSTALRPTPRKASKDRSRAYADGCLAEERATRSKACLYGPLPSTRTVALFGDSHAMQYFPGVYRAALRRGWKMANLTKAGCPAASVTVVNKVLRRAYRECDTWREHTLRRIERERPGLVVLSSATFYSVVSGGDRLGEGASAARLQAGWEATLRRLRATGARVVVIEDAPVPPQSIPVCVRRNLKRLRRCAFPRSVGLDFPRVATRAARAVGGVRVVDPTPKFCLRTLCPAVIGGVLVYRNGGHLTATYVATMTRWLTRRLPEPRPDGIMLDA